MTEIIVTFRYARVKWSGNFCFVSNVNSHGPFDIHAYYVFHNLVYFVLLSVQYIDQVNDLYNVLSKESSIAGVKKLGDKRFSVGEESR